MVKITWLLIRERPTRQSFIILNSFFQKANAKIEFFFSLFCVCVCVLLDANDHRTWFAEREKKTEVLPHRFKYCFNCMKLHSFFHIILFDWFLEFFHSSETSLFRNSNYVSTKLKSRNAKHHLITQSMNEVYVSIVFFFIFLLDNDHNVDAK